MMDSTHMNIGLALGRLRRLVVLCCVLIGFSLMVQLLIWSLVTFTDLRYETLEINESTPLIVTSSTSNQRFSPETLDVGGTAAASSMQSKDISRVLSASDRIFAIIADLNAALGILATVSLVLFIAVSLLLATNSAAPGIESVVASFGWVVLVGLLLLPLGQVFPLPWVYGCFTPYDELIKPLAAITDTETSLPGLPVYARFLILPLTCIIGVGLVLNRFFVGVEAALLPRPDFRLDPKLEAECAKVKPSSLHGGRAAGALSQMVQTSEDPQAIQGSPLPSAGPTQGMPTQLPNATEVSPGTAPRRLI